VQGLYVYFITRTNVFFSFWSNQVEDRSQKQDLQMNTMVYVQICSALSGKRKDTPNIFIYFVLSQFV